MDNELWALIRAARQGGLQAIVAALHQGTGASTALFDLNGNTLAAAPSRTLWDYSRVLAISLDPDPESSVTARRVHVENEPVAILAAATIGNSARLLEAGVDLVTLEVGRLRARQEGRRELTQHVIEDLVHNRVSLQESSTRLRSLGFDPNRRYRVLLGQARMRRERLISVPWNIHALLSNQHEPFIRVVVEGRIFMLVPDDPMVDRIAQYLLRHLQEVGSEASVGISTAYTGTGGIRAGYFEALSASESGTGIQYPSMVDLGHLLTLTTTAVPVRDIAAAALRPLLDYDAGHGTELVRTLHAFLTADRSLNAAADALFIHRNTLRYRLRQIVDLLGHGIDGTRQLSNLWLALQALETGAPAADGD
ncbi:PucR family transcriptional regulator [Arthrobacter sp. GCM10027362]|uniref:PucR family transcriptional regulator n=1 Tax=Arthrobacter sp. GCM10027362 TaxID=3273379 RepID=UPI00362561B6